MLPKALLERANAEVRNLDTKLLSELRAYSSPPEAVYRTLAGALCAAGERKFDVLEWATVRPLLTAETLQRMVRVDAAAKGKRRRWRESGECTCGLTSEAVLKSKPTLLFHKWLA